MVTMLTRRWMCSGRSTCCSAVWVLFLASAFIWAGCSGGSSTEEAADTEKTKEASEEPSVKAPKEQATADATSEEPEPPGEAPFDTTFLDAETELFLFARVGDVLDSSLVQMLTGGNVGSLSKLEQEFGVSPDQIDTVTVGVSRLAQLVEKSADTVPLMASSLMGPQMMPGMPGGQFGGPAMDDFDDAGMNDETMDDFEESPGDFMDDEGDGGGGRAGSPKQSGKGVVAVVRTKSPIDATRFEGKAGFEQAKHAKQTYFRVTSNSSAEKPCLYIFDETTLVASDEVTIKEVIDEGQERARPTADLGFVESAPHVLLAIAPKDKAALNKAGAKFTLPGGAFMTPGGIPNRPRGGVGVTGPLLERRGRYDDEDSTEDETTEDETEAGSKDQSDAFFDEHVDAFALLVDLSAGIGLDIVMKCDAEDAAQQMLSDIDTGLADSKSQFEAMKGTLPGVIRLVAQPVVDSLKATAAEQVLTVSLALPEEQQAMLPMVPAAMMGMMMRGMGSPAGGDLAMAPSLGEFALEVLFDGQSAANSDELPEGLELKALTRWGRSVYGDQAPPPLEIGIVASGGPAADAVAFGRLNLSEARVDGTTSLKWTGTMNDAPGTDPIANLVPVEREGILSDHPRDAVATGFVVAPPVTSVASLSVVAGELTLQVAEGEQGILFPDVKDVRNQRPIGGNLRKLDDLQTSFSTYDRGPYEELEFGYFDSPLVGPVELVDVTGTLLASPTATSVGADGRKTLTYQFPGGLPPATGLRITMYSDVQTVAVPFRFEDLPVPDSPDLTEQQRSLLAWTPAEPPAGIDDLRIEVQGRWRALERVEPVAQGFPPGFGNQQRRFGSGGYDDETMETDLGADETEMEFDDLDDPGADDSAEGSFGGRGPRRPLPGARNPRGAQGAQPVPQSENPLRIVVDLIGPLTETAEGIGFVEVASATTDIDTELTFEGAEIGSGAGNPTEEFIDIDRTEMTAEDHPPGGLRVVLKLTPPNQPIQALARLNGSLKFKTVREKAETIVPNIETRTQSRISHPDLRKIGIQFYAQIQGNRIMMRLAEGREDRIDRVIPVDLNDNPVPNVNTSTQAGGAKAQGRTIHVFDFPGGIPEKVGLKFIVNVGIEETSIPIRIENLPLPPMPAAE